MHIFYDGYIYSSQAAGGINRYFANLIKFLPAEITPTFTTCQRLYINSPDHPNLKTYYYPRFGFHPGRFSYWLEQYYFRAVSTFQRFDLIHPTYYSLLTRQSIDRCRFPVVLTVHDMIHEIFYPTDKWVDLKRKAILAANAILCVSQNTKKDLLERYTLPEEKVTVTHLASEIAVNLSYGSEPVPDCPYYLYVGSRTGYKNFSGLLEAFAKVVSLNSEIKLCVVGNPLTPQEQQRITDLKLQNRIDYYNQVSDRHLAKLYRCSIALVYPSLYEGFGIPPLEAMSCGTVAITSNTSSLPEVVGEAGLTFDPHSIFDLADILLYLLDHPTQRDRLIVEGYKRAKLFSWDRTAAQTLAIYHAVTN